MLLQPLSTSKGRPVLRGFVLVFFHHFHYCVSQFCFDRRVGDRRLDWLCAILCDSQYELRAFGMWHKSGFWTFTQFLHGFISMFRLTKGRHKQFVGSVLHNAFGVAFSNCEFRIENVWSFLTGFLLGGHAFPNYRVFLLVLKLSSSMGVRLVF